MLEVQATNGPRHFRKRLVYLRHWLAPPRIRKLVGTEEARQKTATVAA